MKNTNLESARTNLLIIVILSILLYFKFNSKFILYFSVSLSLISLVSNKIELYINLIWIKIIKLLSYLMPNIILTMFYLFFLTPLAFIAKIFKNKDNRDYILKNNYKSLFKICNKEFTKESFELPW